MQKLRQRHRRTSSIAHVDVEAQLTERSSHNGSDSDGSGGNGGGEMMATVTMVAAVTDGVVSPAWFVVAAVTIAGSGSV